ncbi:MAG: Ig-like domain-containing protein [Synergistaceae bacterium]|nr:Ig-like domain-containing protein [Candidatus Equadaptatus faecalis]
MKLNIKHNNKIFLALIAFLVIAFIGAAHSSDVPVQDSNGYYLIGTAAQLRWFRDQVNSGSKYLKAELTADIDLACSEEEQWTPIGNDSPWAPDGDSSKKTYSGTFDGCGHKISGLYINNNSMRYQGLFGTVVNATIKNLTVSGEINGGEYVGGICGYAYNLDGDYHNNYNNNITISNCVNEVNIRANISTGTTGTAGGICGYAFNGKAYNGTSLTLKEDYKGNITISNCVNEGYVSGHRVGGICGLVEVTVVDTKATILISNCFNSSVPSGFTHGYICGETYYNGSYREEVIKLTGCGYIKRAGYSERSIGTSNVYGGIITADSHEYEEGKFPSVAVMLSFPKTVLAGMEIQPVVDIYPVKAYNKYNVWYEIIESSDNSVISIYNNKAYAIGAGKTRLTVKVTGLLNNSELTFKQEINVTGNIERYVEGIALNKTVCNLHVGDYEQLTATVSPTNATINCLNWTSDNPSVVTVNSTGWVMAVAEGTATITARTIDGSNKYVTCMVTVVAGGAVQDNYLIETAAQLKWFRDQVNRGAVNLNAKLVADIDLDGSEEDQWIPIGNDNKNYSGTFDGCGHKISGLYINNSKSYQGLFGTVENATIKNLTVSGEIKAKNYVGGICGKADGYEVTITDCVTAGTVSGSNYVGGICGYASGDDYSSSAITNCMTAGTVTGSDYVGGICGKVYFFDKSYIDIINCMNAGTVSGSNYVGGIWGYAYNSGSSIDIINCVNTGTVSGSDYVSGICGKAYNYDKGAIHIYHCVNEGTVGASGGSNSYVGGVCGYISNVDTGTSLLTMTDMSIRDCINSGKIIGYNGGSICGYVYNGINYSNRNSSIDITCGYLKGTSWNSVGGDNIDSSDLYCTIHNVAYENNQLPSAAVMLSCPKTVSAGMEIQPVLDIYPVNAYNKNNVRYEIIESSDNSVISIYNNKAYAVGAGKATLTVKVIGLLNNSELTFKQEINVTGNIERYVEGIVLNKTVCNLYAGENEQLTATVNPTNATIGFLKWTSSNPNVATVDSTGRVTAVAEGTAVITAKAIDGSNQSASCTVIVKKTVSIAFAQDMPYIFDVSDGNTDFSKYVVFSGDASDTGKVVWSSSDTSVASVNEKGIVTWKKTGSVTITATSQDDPTKSVSKTLRVEQYVTGITVLVETGGRTLLVKETKQLIANVQPSNAANKDIKWTSSDENIATVDANGLVTAKEITGKTANVTITAEALDGSGVKGTIELTVKRPPVTSMSFGRKSYQVTAGNTKDMYKELVFQPDTALKPAANEITWTSGNVSVDANGLVTMPMTALEIPGFEITGFVMATYRNENGETLKAPTEVSTKAQNINLNLTTKLAGRSSGGKTGSNKENIEVCVYNTANRLLYSGQGTTDENGHLRLEMDGGSVSSGQKVKLWIKGERYLATIQNATVQLNGNDWNITMAETIKGGDANGDNSVNLTDFGILGKSFLKKTGVTGYDARADFNGDNSVNLTDFGILGTSFLKKGETKPKAAVTMLMRAANRNGTTDNALKVLNTETAEVADNALEENADEPEEKQEEAIIEAVEQKTGVTLKAASPTASNETASNSSSSGGCNAGFGILALLFATPLFCRKRK